jgi:hydrogenase/urease accessory protein HupE
LSARASIALLVMWLASAARAHGMRTAYLELTETAEGTGQAVLRLTLLDPQVAFAIDGCALSPVGLAGANAFAFVLHCDGPLAGRTVRVRGLGPMVSEAVVRAALRGGGVRSGVLRADQPELELRNEPTRASIAMQYLRLGVVHIATGYDHLLFLLALALQLWRWRAVLLAETAFTASHTLSFSATALGLVRLPPLAAEACIALSLMLLARELALGQRISPRRGALVALLFGLVHGLGFAGGLREIGLPEHDVSFALLGFGAGVELGQVAFLALVLLALHLRAVATRRPALELAGGWAVGSVGAFWFCQRLSTLFLGRNI